MSVSLQTIQGAGVETQGIRKASTSGQGDAAEGAFVGILMQLLGASFSPADVNAGVKAGLISDDGSLTEKGAQVLSPFELALVDNLEAGEPCTADPRAIQSVLSRIAAELANSTALSPPGDASSRDDASAQIGSAAASTAIILPAMLVGTQITQPSPIAAPLSEKTAVSSAAATVETPAVRTNETGSDTKSQKSINAGQQEIMPNGACFAKTNAGQETSQKQVVDIPSVKQEPPQADNDINVKAIASLPTAPAATQTDRGIDTPASEPSTNQTLTQAPSANAGVLTASPLDATKSAAVDGVPRQDLDQLVQSVKTAAVTGLQTPGDDKTAQQGNAAVAGLVLTGAAAKAGVKIETIQTAAASEEPEVVKSGDAKTTEGTNPLKPEESTPASANKKKAVAEESTEKPQRTFKDTLASADAEKKPATAKTENMQSIRHAEQAVNVAATSTTSLAKSASVEVEPQTVIRQVVDGVSSSIAKDAGRIRIELTPPSLGTLNMDLVVTQDRVRMVILADNSDTRNLLQSNMDQLKTTLQQQGLKIDGIDVSVQGRFLGQSGGQSAGNWGDQHAWHYHGRQQDGPMHSGASSDSGQTATNDAVTNVSKTAWSSGGGRVHVVA